MCVASCEEQRDLSHTGSPQLSWVTLLLLPSMDFFWLTISIGRTVMTHRALGTFFTLIFLNCIRQGNFRFFGLNLASCGIKCLVWNLFWFSPRQTASLWSYDFICLHPSGQYAIPTSKCKWSCLLTFLALNIIWCAWQDDRMVRCSRMRRWRLWRAKTSPYTVK